MIENQSPNNSNANLNEKITFEKYFKNYSIRTYIKDIFIEVPDYKFRHHPYFEKKKDDVSKEDIFIGREKNLENFQNILEDGDSNGVYLVTGYRGMGKTSFVSKTIEKYKNAVDEEKEIKSIKISLAQTKLEEIDILRHIVKKLFQDINEITDEDRKKTSDNASEPTENQKYFLWFTNIYLLLFFEAIALVVIFGGLKLLNGFLNIGSLLFLFAISFGITFKQVLKYKKNIASSQDKDKELKEKITELHDRCFASVIKENQESGGIKDIVNFFQKKSKTYPIANAKEIEYEIVEILGKYYETPSKSNKAKRIIFVFDELDKIEPDIDKGLYQTNAPSSQHDESVKTYLNDLRERRQIIIKVLSSLKFLLTEAKARFIFIAGREMFDAALADTADRQSALSSVFHQIIYVESFLRENPLTAYPHKSNINYLIEKYLDIILIPVDIQEELNIKHKNDTFLRRYGIYLYHLKMKKIIAESDCPIEDEAIIKVLFTLQNFITYLSYRTNGSPKKIIKTIEEIFVDEKTLKKSIYGDEIDEKYLDKDFTVIISPTTEEKIPSQSTVSNKPNPKSENKEKSRIFLNFSFKQQYKYAFNAYLFYPFLSMQANTLSNYSDSVLVSTPFLMDNLIKYHPFAFSIHNLELTPEILSTNKTPELRYFVEELVNYLSQNHIRETESGLFQYKFFDRTHNEISFISKIFDEESAAFNFSLDESYAIKTHIASKIKYLRGVFKEYKKKDTPVIESLTFLNDILGDSQLFDEFYEDAIIAFLDTTHGIENPKPNETPIDVFILWMRVKLKLAMVYEKMKYYEQAMAQLGLAMNVAVAYIKTDPRIIAKTSSTAKTESQPTNTESNIQQVIDIDNNNPTSQSLNELESEQISPIYREVLQITQQAILASMYVQEKFAEGLTFAKLENYMQLYADIHKHNFYQNYNGRDLMMSNFYAHFGTLLYYKNKTLPLNTTLEINPTKNPKEITSTEDLNEYVEGAILKIQDTPLFRLSEDKYNTILFFPFVKDSYEEVGRFFPKYGVKQKESYYRDFRFSFTTYVTYKKSLATYLATDKTELEELINKSVTVLMNFRNVHGTRKLIGLANIITKIADLLITLVDKQEYNPSEIFRTTRFNYEKEKVKQQSLTTNLDYSCFDKDKFEFVEKWEKENKINVNYILLLYYLSGRLYLKAGRSVTAAFQFKKILLSLHNCRLSGRITGKTINDYQELNNFIEETFLVKILEFTSWNSNSSDRPQISANKYIGGIKNISLPPNLTRKYYLNLSNNPDTKEAILLFANLKIRGYVDLKNLKEIKENVKELNIIGNYNSISHQMVRVMELDIQVRINRLILSKIINPNLRFIANDQKVYSFFNSDKVKEPTTHCWEKDLYAHSYNYKPDVVVRDYEFGLKKVADLLDYFSNLSSKPNTEIATDNIDSKGDKLSQIEYLDLYCNLIVNSLFCLHQSIISLNLYGINYMQNYSYLASFHERMGDWLKHYGFCKLLFAKIKKNFDATTGKPANSELFNILNKMFENVEKLIGNNSIRNIEDSLSHYQLALQYYQKCVQMHSEGITYKSQMNNMIYLEDDYNDNLNHFGAALERQLINSGTIRYKLQKLERELEISRLFKYKNFLNE